MMSPSSKLHVIVTYYHLMKKLIFFIVCGASMFSHNILFAQEFPSDKNATKETVNLYRNLKKLLNKGIMFGHQDDLAYGVGWKYEQGRSDIKDITDDYPAVYGWELGRIELDNPVNL